MAKSAHTHPVVNEAKGACLGCHDPHTVPPKTSADGSPQEVCTKCHDFTKHTGHPMGPGVIDPRTHLPVTCLSCHQQHGSEFKFFLRQDPSGRLCVQCHTEKIHETPK